MPAQQGTLEKNNPAVKVLSGCVWAIFKTFLETYNYNN